MRTIQTSILFVALAACGTQQANNTDQLDAPVGKADAASQPSGPYTNATPHFGELTTISLNADHTFTLTEIAACSGTGIGCSPTLSGTWLFTHGTSNGTTRHYLRLYAEDGTALDRYQWKLTSDGSLQLEADGDNHWFTMARGATCDSAGGNCVALVPDACQIGSVGDATEYSCGGGVGVECCLPAQAPNSCHADADCTGALPQFCRVCSDGSTECAHWSCVSNACEITSCN
jgi:hypothetical protein